jgi:hypothetical protein
MDTLLKVDFDIWLKTETALASLVASSYAICWSLAFLARFGHLARPKQIVFIRSTNII